MVGFLQFSLQICRIISEKVYFLKFMIPCTHNAHKPVSNETAKGIAPGQSYRVVDLLTGSAYTWGERNYVRLAPQVEPAHIMRVERGA